MTEITLEFLAEQQKKILDRLGTIEDQQTVLTGIVMRLDGFATELRGMLRMLERLEHRVRKAEEP
jgi:hypothetical protein